MSNPAPSTKQLIPYQYKQSSREPRGKVRGTRYPLSADAILDGMNPTERADFIRGAVIEKLKAEGLLQPSVKA